MSRRLRLHARTHVRRAFTFSFQKHLEAGRHGLGRHMT